MQRWLHFHSFKGLNDVVIAYNSISLVYDPVVVRKNYNLEGPVHTFISQKLADAFEHSSVVSSEQTIIHIPVCYSGDYAPDMEAVTQLKQISDQEVVRLHTQQPYRVYMIGFLPGFPYMAAVPGPIAVPRKKQPSLVTVGSVGIAGEQTGIYPLSSPGGWQIVGRTPVKVFDPAASDPFLIKAGNYVQFYAITVEEFIHWNP